jgi:hypothetical protein
MGHDYRAECKECGCKFEVSEGGGFVFPEAGKESTRRLPPD